MRLALLSLFRSQRLYLGAVIASLVITFLRTPALNGTFAGLVLTVILQLYLPGYLLARAVGRHRLPHPISRFAWTLVCGLGLTVSLGAAARLLNVPVAVYLLLLHGVMLVLALLPSPAPVPAAPWRMTRAALPLYILVAVSCLVVFGVSYESRYRFFGFEDQPIFISHMDWLAHHPDERPHDLPLRSRQIGVLNGDTRFDTDGWTYNHAAWVWASGVPGWQLVWYDLGTLFIWAVPLLTFALAYELTEREGIAALSAAALAVAGLLTLDNVVHNPAYTALGRLTVFQISVLRQMSLTIMLPLSLMAAFAYLRCPARRGLIVVALAGVALASMHPIQTMIFVMSVAVTILASWLAEPTRARLLQRLPLALLLLFILVLPFVQRLNRSGLGATDSVVDVASVEEGTVTVASNPAFLILPDLPIIGTTYIRNPANVFYSPVIILAVLLALACGWWWRRSLAAQYIFSATLLALLIFFTPGLTELFDKVASSVGLLTSMFLIPVPLAYGVGLTLLAGTVSKSLPPLPAVGWRWLAAVAGVGLMLALVFEPFPIPASARDQIRAFNAMQALRRLHPAQVALADSLRGQLTPGVISVLATPYDVANVVIEAIPDTLITGGRRNRNLAIDGNNRLMNEAAVDAPWLDTADLAFLAEWDVTHLVMLADMTRLPQLLLQPERFEMLDTTAGYWVFRLKPDIVADDIDALYGDMNQTYATMTAPRWGRDGFNLILPGDSEAWRPFVARWQAILDEQPEDDRAWLGLAFTYTMMGADDVALPLWRRLYQQHPNVSLYADALASTLQVVDTSQDSIQPLVAQLNSAVDSVRVLAARRLLTDTFFYRLDAGQLETVVGVMGADSVTWDRLANLGKQQPLRDRAALLMDAGQWAAAGAELDALPYVELAPEDIAARAAIQLAQGDVPGALDILRPATDPDQVAANRFLHPDRWESNLAAQMYYLVQAGVAARADRTGDTGEQLSQAVRLGAVDVQTAAGAAWAAAQDSQAAFILPSVIADHRSLYVMQPQVTRENETALTITATYSGIRPRGAYPIQSWRVQVVSPDSSRVYAETDVPAVFADPYLIRVGVTLPLDEDIPPLSPALVIIEPRHNDAVTASPAILPVVLNRPDSVPIPALAHDTDYRFSDGAETIITLEGYQADNTAGSLDLTLYWQTNNTMAEDYQVFVHVIDSDGQQIAGGDSAPVNNLYPTSQWRPGVTIADPRAITFDPPLPPGDYTVRIGLYRLPGGERLRVLSTGDRVQDNSVALHHFTISE